MLSPAGRHNDRGHNDRGHDNGLSGVRCIITRGCAREGCGCLWLCGRRRAKALPTAPSSTPKHLHHPRLPRKCSRQQGPVTHLRPC